MEKEPCLKYGDKNVVKGQYPNCKRPYSLYCYSAEMTKGKERDSWTQALKRENLSRAKWTPKSNGRICSLHFVDGISAKANPLTTIHMGYDTKR